MSKIKPLLEKKNILPMCFLATVVIDFFIVLILGLIFVRQGAIEARMTRILVQEADGSTFVAGNDEKTPSAVAIKYFVQHWLREQYRFSGITFDSEGKVVADRGIELKSGSDSFLVPLNVYEASFAVPSENRHQFLYSLIQEWMPQNYFQPQKTTAEFEIKEMAEPELLKNVWAVEVIAQLNYSNSDNEIESRQFRRTIFIQPTEVPLSPSRLATLQEKLTYKWRSKGFLVVGME